MAATILQLSDVHLPPTPGEPVFGRDADERLAAVLAACEDVSTEADLLLLTGDLTNEGDTGATGRVAAAASTLGLPMLALPGNHDRPATVSAAFGDEMTIDPRATTGARVIHLGDDGSVTSRVIAA